MEILERKRIVGELCKIVKELSKNEWYVSSIWVGKDTPSGIESASEIYSRGDPTKKGKGKKNKTLNKKARESVKT